MNIHPRLRLAVLLLVALTSALLASNAHALTATTTTLATSASVFEIDQGGTLTATVTGASPTGNVSFNVIGFGTLGTAPVISGKATLTLAQVPTMLGTFAVQAAYPGDPNNAPSTSPSINVTITKKTTSISLSVIPNPVYQGQSLTIQAIVKGYGATGMVTFKDGTTTLGSSSLGPVAGGSKATWTTTLSGLNHSLSASYVGDTYNTASTSPVFPLQIGIALPTSPAPVADYEYDAQGNPTKVTLAKGVSGFGFQSSNTFDALNRIKDTTDARSGKTQFGYDGVDRTIKVTDPRNLSTQTPRNGLGDTTSLISPDTGTATHTYDAAGNLKTRTDSRGVLTTHTYDELNRVTSTVYSKSGSANQTHTWTYDQTGAGYANGVGRLTSTGHPAGSAQYTYDPQGRVLTDTQRVALAVGANPAQVTNVVTYGYDGAGHVTSIVYPSGRKLTVTYAGGQPTSMSLAKDAVSTATTLVSAIKITPFGAVKSWQWQMASTTDSYDRVYDLYGRPVRYRLGNTIRDLTYDAGDRIKAYTHYDATTVAATPALDQSFMYDELGRLIQTTLASASWSFDYDANGNRKSATVNGNTRTYTTSVTSNWLTNLSNPAKSFGQDTAGNTTSNGDFTATYDLSGRMNTLTNAGVTTTYTYDGLGRRVRKFNGSGAASTVIFAYDQDGHLLGEYDSTGKAIREVVWLGATPVAVFTPDPANVANPPLVYYIHTDHLDTPRVIVDRNNKLRWRWLAEPFGVNAAENNPDGMGVFTFNLRFPGQYFDAESGLYYNYFRSYDASIGRYAQSDPIGLDGGTNTYSYVSGNPLSSVDPFGLLEYTCLGCHHGQPTPAPTPTPGPKPPGGSPRPDAPPQSTPIPNPYEPTPIPASPTAPSRERFNCEADALLEKTERDALCFIAKARAGKGAQARCLTESDLIYREDLERCKKTCP